MVNLCEFLRVGSNAGTKAVEARVSQNGLTKAVNRALTVPSANVDMAAQASSNYAIGGIVMRDAKKPIAEVSSEFMTHLSADGKTLVKKLTNGKTVESVKLPDGTIKTTVINPNGTKYVRSKSYTTKELEENEAKAMNELFPDFFSFKRVDKNVKMTNSAGIEQGLGPMDMAKSGRVYGTNLEDFTQKPVLSYKPLSLSSAERINGYDISLLEGKNPQQNIRLIHTSNNPKGGTKLYYDDRKVLDKEWCTRPNLWWYGSDNDIKAVVKDGHTTLKDLAAALDLPKGY